MCVICVKPEGKDLPTLERIKSMFEANSDGAGLMYVRGGKVVIRKGFMKLKHVYRAIADENLTKDDLVVFHFRIATAGSTSPKNCHPFPISTAHSDLRATRFETDLAMAHNGILDYVEDKKADLSDTMTFTRDVLADVSIRKHIMEPSVFALLEMAIGHSKMVFLHKSRQFTLLGDWVEDKTEKDGLYYSNLNFTYRYRPSATLYYNSGHGYYTTERPGVTENTRGHLSLVPRVSDNDLDKEAYENSGGVSALALSQSLASVAIFPEDEECPNCETPMEDDKQLFCRKCGKMFDRSFND